MAYTTEAAVRTASGFSNTTNITSATITAYMADSEAVINAKVADIYTLPLSGTSELIEALSRAITVGLLYANEYGEESQNTDKGWQERLKWAMDVLDQIQQNKMKLYTTAGVELTRSSLTNPVFSPTTSSSEADAEDTDEPKLTMNMLF